MPTIEEVQADIVVAQKLLDERKRELDKLQTAIRQEANQQIAALMSEAKSKIHEATIIARKANLMIDFYFEDTDFTYDPKYDRWDSSTC